MRNVNLGFSKIRFLHIFFIFVLVFMWNTAVLQCKGKESKPFDSTQKSDIKSSGAIADKVLNELKNNPKLATGVQVKIVSNSGIVSMTGYTTTLMQRQIIAETLEKIEGVEHLESSVFVQPRIISEDQFIREMHDAIKNIPGLSEPDKIQISIKNGEVLLQGITDDVNTIWTITDVIMNVPGILNIDNQIAVKQGKSPEPESDDMILKKVLAELKKIPELNLASIDVKVRKGQAIISGSLPSPEILYSVKTAVTTVTKYEPDTNNLVAIFKTGSFESPEPTSNNELRDNINKVLKGISDLDTSKITVSVSEGKVTLEGSVKNEDMISKIKEAIVGVPGVNFIVVNLEIK
ncbi:MAG: hypothetical protein A2161_22585 [Candidatus Schekmanbacteria bacterium RBG_13_48_7]|uniref:BON domain-containing protein n=1 Tax=Candidatus Schekmanbacteria bacterium RBG_13_48_7 TaxID=1817878 RepID=A0A1F7RRZ5_9BACT|nr:MAG: hypothetical protein A2161_22585 [Candidatus Schekmanbacteria bacterium RBG_13_48_7]